MSSLCLSPRSKAWRAWRRCMCAELLMHLCTAGEWDMTACTRLRRVFLSWGIATRLSKEGQDLKLPPACTAAVQF